MISVIVPIFRVAQYLPRCIASLCNQTYRDLEIILIDDGSDDDCADICDRYAQLDNRIHVYHEHNRGTAQAITYGISRSSGKYLGFVDGDDYIEPNMYEILLKDLVDEHADIACCNYYSDIEKSGEIKTTERLDSAVLTSENNGNLAKYLLPNDVFKIAPCRWNKLFTRAIVSGASTDTDKLVYGEDMLLNFRIFAKATKFVYNNTPLYHYIIRDTSIIGSGKSFWQDMRHLIAEIKTIIATNDIQDISDNVNGYIMTLINREIVMSSVNKSIRIKDIITDPISIPAIKWYCATQRGIKKLYAYSLRWKQVWLINSYLKICGGKFYD